MSVVEKARENNGGIEQFNGREGAGSDFVMNVHW